MYQFSSKYQVIKSMNVPASYREAGFVYVLKNDSMPGIYKIGMTKNTPESRAKEISSTTGVPSPFSVLAAFHSSNPSSDERAVHEAFSRFRVSENREFFRFTDNEISDLLTELSFVVGPERDEQVAELAIYNAFISFSKEKDIDLEEELESQGLGGTIGSLSSIKNFLIRAGIEHVKDVVSKHNASIVICPDGDTRLIKSYETQWMEEQHEQQCSKG